jgi:hypothetical protein
MENAIFIIPYLGKWPVWADLFFKSVGHNRSVRILIFCENRPTFELPSNVSVEVTTREALISRLSEATGLAIQSITGHKLCDFRPWFGIAFRDMIAEFEFWGFCDIDMMFGNLGKLLTKDFLKTVDVFSAHNAQIVGHFTILRNCQKVNNLGFQIPEYAKKCLAPTNQMLDEFAFTEAIGASDVRWVRPNNLADELRSSLARFGITFRFTGAVAYLDEADAPVIRWEDGTVYYVSANVPASEVLYVHFMGLKRWWHWCFSKLDTKTQKSFSFSRVGYGCVEEPLLLLRFPWAQIYWTQRTFLFIKSHTGTLLRRYLPQDSFLKIRRAIFGRSRY